MNTLVIYDSLYGNTNTIAQTIADAIPGEVKMLHVKDVNVSELGGYDLLIVGAPTHGAKPSDAVSDMLQNIETSTLEGTKVAAFDTRLTNKWILIFGTAAPKIAKSLKNKGGTLVVEGEGFFVTGGEGPLQEGEIERAEAWAKEIVRLMNGYGDASIAG